ncbi:hypothetical protein B566_EDAN018972, partial [Ephemera danica]
MVENSSPTTTQQNVDDSTTGNQASMLNRSIPLTVPNTSTGCSCRHLLTRFLAAFPVYKIVGSTGVSLVQLLAYISSCCNPITYCFMNKKFRQAFIGAFDCFKQKSSLFLTNRGSEISANESALYAGRASTVAKS